MISLNNPIPFAAAFVEALALEAIPFTLQMLKAKGISIAKTGSFCVGILKYAMMDFEKIPRKGVFSQPEVSLLGEVANFVTDYFPLPINTLAKEIYQTCKILAISANRCWLLPFLGNQ